MNPSKLIFGNNEPVEVALKYAAGKLVSGTYGDQWYYSLALPEGMGMYLDPEVAAKVTALKVVPGEAFWICKRKTFGKGGFTRWDVWRGDEKGPVERKLDAEGERSQLMRDMGRSVDRAQSPARQPKDNGWENSFHGELAVPKENGNGQPVRLPPVQPAAPVLEDVRQPNPTPVLVEIARSYSFKLNVGNYESRDFFCSQKAECRPEEAEAVSERLYEFCRRQVLRAVEQETQQRRSA